MERRQFKQETVKGGGINSFRIYCNEGEILGYLKGADFPSEKSKEDRGELFILTVEEDHRRKGIGTQLILEAIGAIKKAGCKTVKATCPNKAGRALLAKIEASGKIKKLRQAKETTTSEYLILK